MTKHHFNNVFFSLVLILTSCSIFRTNPKVMSTNSSYNLSNAEIKNYIKQAEAKNSIAALKLYDYFMFIKLDRDSAFFWLLLAATNGSTTAQYNAGLSYSGEIYPDLKNLSKAKFWFNQAAINGDQDAKTKLRELNELNSTSQP